MKLELRTDRILIRAAVRSTRYVAVSLTAPEAPRRRNRIPVNVTLVLDRSGSMQGEKFRLPRLIFFVMLLVAALGTYGLVARGTAVRVPVLDAGGVGPLFRVGSTERLMVFGGVAGLFALFLLLQISYLFGNSPAVPGSGVTFAEYAHRGFAELSVVATLCSLLIIVLDDAYLARDLSRNAIPAILDELAALPPELSQGPRSILAARYAQNALVRCS